jgi:hypothetical protein
MSLGMTVIMGLVAAGAALGLILALAGRKGEPETEQEWLDRQW